MAKLTNQNNYSEINTTMLSHQELLAAAHWIQNLNNNIFCVLLQTES